MYQFPIKLRQEFAVKNVKAYFEGNGATLGVTENFMLKDPSVFQGMGYIEGGNH